MEILRERCRQYKKDNQDVLRAKNKIYKQLHQDEIKLRRRTKATCICGKDYTIDHRLRHEKSLKHQQYIKDQLTITPTSRTK